ncbi:MAG TPA: hypothetical protein VMA13_06635, partial [Candidatus Saccharimonadales bacterium]|nr:hypothetical protein [Candidatus Saccharimonadales bacterium]
HHWQRATGARHQRPLGMRNLDQFRFEPTNQVMEKPDCEHESDAGQEPLFFGHKNNECAEWYFSLIFILGTKRYENNGPQAGGQHSNQRLYVD